jgi:hypothetical protein
MRIVTSFSADHCDVYVIEAPNATKAEVSAYAEAQGLVFDHVQPADVPGYWDLLAF